MYYWNKSNFDSLIAIADHLDGVSSVEGLADYCRLRERGLRKQAFLALEKYFERVRVLDRIELRKECRTVIEVHHRNQSAHQLLSDPLYKKFIEPTLVEWTEAQPNDAFAAKWYGILRGDDSSMSNALAIEPRDIHLRAVLIKRYLGKVQYSVHHLNEDFFIGEVAEAESWLQEASDLLSEAEPRAAFTEEREELQMLSQMVADWQEYVEEARTGFIKWCAERGRDYF